MSYRNTLQADALKLVAKKLQSSLAVEGELPEDGLAAYGDDGDDMMMALARKLVLDHDRGIVSGEDEDEAETVEAVFAQARDAESAAEELLVDDSWKPVEPEPETIAVNGNGANGHHDLFGVGPTVELVPANSLSHTGYGGTHPSTGAATATTRRPTSLRSRCSPGPSSWPRSRSSRSAASANPARNHLDVRVGADAGARKRGRAGRRETLDRSLRGEDADMRRPLPVHTYMRPFLRFRLLAQPHRVPVTPAPRSLLSRCSPPI